MRGSRGRGRRGPDPPGKENLLNAHGKIIENMPQTPPPANTIILWTPPFEKISGSAHGATMKKETTY